MSPNEAKPLLVLPLLRDSFTTKNYDWIVTVALAVICTPTWIGLIFLLTDYHWSITFASNVLSAIAIIFISQRLRPDWAWEKDFTGKSRLFKDGIELSKGDSLTVLPLTTTSTVRITSNYYRGGGRNRRTHNGVVVFQVDDVLFKTVLTSKKDFYALQTLLKDWYLSGVPITEKYCEEDYGALLLEPYGNYADVQRTKAELGIS